MTVVVYKRGVVAADRLLSSGYSTQLIRKLHVLPDGRLAAGAGLTSDVAQWMAMLRGDIPRTAQRDNFQIDGIVVASDYTAEVYNNSYFPYPLIDNDFMVVGSDAACFAAQVLHRQGLSADAIVELIANENGFSGVDKAEVVDGKWIVQTLIIGE